MDLQEKFYNANSAIYLAVLLWWIVCLWIDEPGSKAAGVAEELSIEGEPESPVAESTKPAVTQS